MIWRYLRWFHNNTRETYVPSETTITDLEGRGFERVVLWRRGVDSSLFRPGRPGRLDVRRALGWSPDDVVISYVSRIAPEKNVDYLADALAIVASRRPDVRILLVGDGPSRPALEQRIGSIRPFRGLSPGGRPVGPLRGLRHLCFLQPDRDLRQCRARGDGVGLARRGRSGPAASARRSNREQRAFSSNRRSLPRASPRPSSLIEHPEQRTAMARAAREYALSQSWDAIMGGLRERYQRRDRRARRERSRVLGRSLERECCRQRGASNRPKASRLIHRPGAIRDGR